MSGKKGCKFCDKTGLRMLPLIYSVLSSKTPDDLKEIAKFPDKLGSGVSDIALSNFSKYSAKILRKGFLYVLLERAGVKYWTAYQALKDGYLYGFEADSPPQIAKDFSCDPSVCGIDASMIDISNAQDVPHAWMLFTPHAMTFSKLNEYKKMQRHLQSKAKCNISVPQIG